MTYYVLFITLYASFKLETCFDSNLAPQISSENRILSTTNVSFEQTKISTARSYESLVVSFRAFQDQICLVIAFTLNPNSVLSISLVFEQPVLKLLRPYMAITVILRFSSFIKISTIASIKFRLLSSWYNLSFVCCLWGFEQTCLCCPQNLVIAVLCGTECARDLTFVN